MATVYITQRLLDDVRGNIQRMRDAEIRSDFPNHDSAVTDDASELFRTLNWGEHVNLYSMIPEKWKTEFSGFSITVIDEVGMQIGTVGFDKQRAWGTPKADYWSSRNTKIQESDLMKLPDSPGVLAIRNRLSALRGVKDLQAKWKKVETDVIEFLRKCKSLNEALKLLPTLRMYVSPEDVERVERKAESTKARRAELVKEAPAEEELTAAAMAARLSGAFA